MHQRITHFGTVRNRRSDYTSGAGFTMVEILIVLSLIGLVAMISIRSVGDTMRRDRVQKALAIVATDLEQSFALAARQRAPIRLLIDSTHKTFAAADRADTTMKFRTRQFATGDLALDYISTSSASLDVMPSGLSSDTLKLRLGIYSKNGTRYDRTLRMTRGGLVRIQ